MLCAAAKVHFEACESLLSSPASSSLFLLEGEDRAISSSLRTVKGI